MVRLSPPPLFRRSAQKRPHAKAAIAAALAMRPPQRTTDENWSGWVRFGWHGCPGQPHRTCSDSACRVGATCKCLAALGLAGDRSPLPRKDRPCCGARTRKGTACLLRVEPGKRRCRLHGGLSAGPRTAEGKERIAAAQRKWWQEWRVRGDARRVDAAH